MDTQSSSCHRRTKIKHQKSVVKVVCDILTQKCVFVKRTKVRTNFKLSSVPPSSPSSHHEPNLRNEGFKLARDRLTKKGIIAKKNWQLRDIIDMTFLLGALRMPFRCCSMLLFCFVLFCSLSVVMSMAQACESC